MNIDQMRIVAGLNLAPTHTTRAAKQSPTITMFWVVVDPTETSTIDDILWSDNPQQYSKAAILGGHQSREACEKRFCNVAFYNKETPAKKDANKRLAARDVELKAITPPAEDRAHQDTATVDIPVSRFAINLSDEVDCPICGKAIAKDMMQMHVDSTHPQHDVADVAEAKKDKASDGNTPKIAFKKGQKVMYAGTLVSIEVPNAKGDFVGIVPVGKEGVSDQVDLVRSHKVTLAEDAEDATVWTSGFTDKLSMSSSEEDALPTPLTILKSLRDEIANLKKEADRVKLRGDGSLYNFYHQCTDAMEVLLKNLEVGTVSGIQDAQIHMLKLMSPIIQRIPNDVYKFITAGGAKTSLKTLFNAVNSND